MNYISWLFVFILIIIKLLKIFFMIVNFSIIIIDYYFRKIYKL